MRVLLDECVPARLKRALAGHAAKTVPEAGWRSTKDAGLLRMAAGSFDVFVTVDRNMERHDVSSLRLGLIIAHVRSNRLVDFQPVLSDLAEAIGTVKPGEVIHVRAARG